MINHTIGLIMDDLHLINPATTPTSSSVFFIQEGVKLPAQLMFYEKVDDTWCAYIQHFDEHGDVYSHNDRPENANDFVYINQLYISTAEIEFMSDLVH